MASNGILCPESPGAIHMDCLNFNSMTFGATQARRLSTASSVTKPPHFILTTEWIWYWSDDFGSWQEYGRQEPNKSPSIVAWGIRERAKDPSPGSTPTSHIKKRYLLVLTQDPWESVIPSTSHWCLQELNPDLSQPDT
ncbi:hypothetical protein P7K49_025761 [Saguinus oedipus]|uniref:Uncharacterized protein n=1 Tax=Saguinus oedipus TaxID=9490 RepID=A0ABQ9UKE1_SAGOE|nr:hypothetical protein P7K49_025761 [Saguinus oedipus]